MLPARDGDLGQDTYLQGCGMIHVVNENWIMYILQGLTLGVYMQSVSWDQPQVAGDIPVPRAGHTLACVGGRNLLFGGFGCKEGMVIVQP